MKKSIRTVVQPTQEEIARLAYFFFEESGRKEGFDVEHWLQAQAHLCTDCLHTVPVEERTNATKTRRGRLDLGKT